MRQSIPLIFSLASRVNVKGAGRSNPKAPGGGFYVRGLAALAYDAADRGNEALNYGE
jgi:hypothetical protein